jgi:pimeloyl-ACP methyl ester carboxylesterase
MPGTVPADLSNALAGGAPARDGLSDDEHRAHEQLLFLHTKGIGYATEMSLRPQTLYGLGDLPVQLAAWMLDHDARSYEDIASAFAGRPVGNLTRDEGRRQRLPARALQAPRSWAEQAYPNLIYFHHVERGNHFAAWQEPDFFTAEVRAAFRSLR